MDSTAPTRDPPLPATEDVRLTERDGYTGADEELPVTSSTAVPVLVPVREDSTLSESMDTATLSRRRKAYPAPLELHLHDNRSGPGGMPSASSLGEDPAWVGSEGGLAFSPGRDVVTPPYMPSSKHHNFFMETDSEEEAANAASPLAAVNRALRKEFCERSRSGNAAHGSERHTSSSSSGAADIITSGSGGGGENSTHAHGEESNDASETINHAIDPQSPERRYPSRSPPRRQHANQHDETMEIVTPEKDSVLVSPAEKAFPNAATAAAAPGEVVPAENTRGRWKRQKKVRYGTVAVAPPYDPAREQQWNLLDGGRTSDLPLYQFEEIPVWQKYNPYIRAGYRAYYDTRMSLRSLLGWHNETLNVWSHLTGFFIFVVLTVLLYSTYLSGGVVMPNMSMVKWAYGFLCAGSMLCMLTSSVYHLFTGHCSLRAMTAWGRADFIGITILIVASLVAPVYTTFHCFPVARKVYITIMACLGLAGIVGPWTKLFYDNLLIRTFIYVGMAVVGMVPTIHAFILLPLNETRIDSAVGFCLMLLLYGVGVIFYVTQFPESSFPGHFDRFLCSHQLWHFFVLMAALVHYFNCVSMYQLWLISDGVC